MSDKTHGPWPIRQWLDRGTGGFIVEDDQGYNFSFPTRSEAEDFRAACFAFQEEMQTRAKPLIARFKEELFS